MGTHYQHDIAVDVKLTLIIWLRQFSRLLHCEVTLFSTSHTICFRRNPLVLPTLKQREVVFYVLEREIST